MICNECNTERLEGSDECSQCHEDYGFGGPASVELPRVTGTGLYFAVPGPPWLELRALCTCEATYRIPMPEAEQVSTGYCPGCPAEIVIDRT